MNAITKIVLKHLMGQHPQERHGWRGTRTESESLPYRTPGAKNKPKVVTPATPKRGRPAGSKNKPKVAPPAKPKRGRPAGSTAKPKPSPAPVKPKLTPTPVKPKRGRPAGSTAKPKPSPTPVKPKLTPAPVKPKRGRPAGSTAKPKPATTQGSGRVAKPSVTPPPLPARRGTTKVSVALDLTSGVKSLSGVKEALAIIDSVHRDGDLPKIPVRLGRSYATAGSLKILTSTLTGYSKVDSMVLSKSGFADPISVTIHEVGHFLDIAGLSRAVGYKGNIFVNKFTNRETEPGKEVAREKFVKLLDAIQNSPLANKINSAIRSPRRFENKYGVLPQSSALRYHGDRREIFARSYVQYIARKSKNKKLIEAMLDEVESTGTYGDFLYHDKNDFAPIEKAFDDLFAEIGWI